VYGEPGPGTPDGLQPEEGPLGTPELYAVSKLAAELVARRYGELACLDVRTVRLSGVFGPLERPTGSRILMSPVHAVVEAATGGRALRVTGRTLSSVGDHVSAEDVADGLARLLRAPALRHDTYNLADGRLTGFAELADAVRAAGADLHLEVVPDAAGADLDL